MNVDAAVKSNIVDTYRSRTQRSAARHQEALNLLPSGIVHDSRRIWPYGVYGERALGSRKWDIDGNEYIDYYGGHGSLLLGHQHPQVVAAAQAQLNKGMHFAAAHELEVEWATLVREMVPCAERVRFTSSGTEATHLAIRLARAASGKPKIIRFIGNFHGWHDHVAFGNKDNADGKPLPGITPEVTAGVVLVRVNDLAEVERQLSTRNDIGAVMIEPLGTSSGAVPTSPVVLRELREITRRHGAFLIFDEVVSGFRAAPGGLQAAIGVTPDLAALAKVLAGGMPGGAVVGRKDILDWLDFDVSAAAKRERISHQGTHNAHPVCAAAGIATLKLIRDTDVCERATARANELRRGMNQVLEDEGIPWAVYGDYSFFHFFTNPENRAIKPTAFDAHQTPGEWFKPDKRERMQAKLVLSLMNHGVDPKGARGGIVSAAHTAQDVARTLEAWRRALRALRDEGDLN
ncbi:MAG: aminotransferase class III-fold pyridoxal phosphate-dependent enzyme [Betaproteobacteria bacterium]|nr:aminotransferase class III-fold pyridoxal phosphate-dependent enzyme [Betaproteobacteria bacterium]